MKKMQLIPLILTLSLVTACSSGISEEDHEAVLAQLETKTLEADDYKQKYEEAYKSVAEVSTLQTDNKELENSLKDLQSKYDDLKDKYDELSKPVKTEKKSKNSSKILSCDLTAIEFTDKLNSNLKGTNVDLTFTQDEKSDDAVMLTTTNNLHAISVNTDNNTKITNIYYIGQGDSSDESGVTIMMTLIAIVMTVDDSLSSTVVGETVGILLREALDGNTGKLDRNGNSYTLSISKSVGTILSIEPTK